MDLYLIYHRQTVNLFKTNFILFLSIYNFFPLICFKVLTTMQWSFEPYSYYGMAKKDKCDWEPNKGCTKKLYLIHLWYITFFEAVI